MNLASPLYITGYDAHKHQPILAGIFQMHDRVGFPVDCCIDEAKAKGFSIDWLEALADCWLNDCLKFDSFVRQVSMQVTEVNLEQMFFTAGALLMQKYPKIHHHKDPVNVVCKYILRKKRMVRL